MKMLPGRSAAIQSENAKTAKAGGASEREAVLVSMRLAKRDKEKEVPSHGPMGHKEQYPYGTRIELEHEQLNKLGMSQSPKVGDKMKLHAHVTVHRASHSEDEHGGGPRRSVGLQITKMKLK